MELKNAWIYCSIDAPEDIHGILKGQYEQLENYATQMKFTVVGSSQDLGRGLKPMLPGLLSVLEAAKAGTFQIFLVDINDKLKMHKNDHIKMYKKRL